MDKNIILDFAVKAANLCRYLQTEKGELLISQKLFDSCCALSSALYSIDDPSLSKAELSAAKKGAASAAGAALLYLDMLLSSGFISDAQKQSVIKNLTALRKAANI